MIYEQNLNENCIIIIIIINNNNHHFMPQYATIILMC